MSSSDAPPPLPVRAAATPWRIERSRGGWATLRVLISGTFSDFMGERDVLASQVFPRLRASPAVVERALRVIEIDLRWGLTREDAEHGRVVELCLTEVDRCRPLLYCLLGARYGWVPPRDEIALSDAARYGFVFDLDHGISVTELEIAHGILMEPESCEMEVVASFRRSIAPPELGEFAPQGTDRLDRLKAALRKRAAAVHEYDCTFDTTERVARDLDSFAELAFGELQAALLRVADRIDASAADADAPTAPHDESVEQSLFVEARSTGVLGRDSEIGRIIDYCKAGVAAADPQWPLVLVSEPGCGKSSVMAAAVRALGTGTAALPPGTRTASVFVGASPRSTELGFALALLLRQLGHSADSATASLEELRQTFKTVLEERTPTLLFVDAVNQFDAPSAAKLLWLPRPLPPHVACVISTLRSSQAWDVLRVSSPVLDMPRLSREHARSIVAQTLARAGKTLTAAQLDLIADKPSATLPLYLAVVAEECRIFGTFAELDDKIHGLAPDTDVLFAQVLERLEERHSPQVVSTVLSLVSCSGGRLSEEQIFRVLRTQAPFRDLARAKWSAAALELRSYLTQARQDDPLHFFHRQLGAAVRRRYLAVCPVGCALFVGGDRCAHVVPGCPGWADKDRSVHALLVAHYAELVEQGDADAIALLPVHQALAMDWAGLRASLGSLAFLERAHAARAIRGVNHAARSVVDDLAQAQAPDDLMALLRKVSEFLVREAAVLAAYTVPSLVSQQALAWGLYPGEARHGSTASLLTRSQTEGVETLGGAVCGVVGPLYTVCPAGPTSVATAGLDRFVRIWDRESGLVASEFVASSNGPVLSVSVSPDGSMLAAGGEDGVIRVFDLSGSPIRTLEDHGDAVYRVRFVGGAGRVAMVSASADQSALLWSDSFEPLQRLLGHTGRVVTLDTHGALLATGGYDGDVRLYSLESGEAMGVLGGGHTETVHTVGFAPSGDRLVSGSADRQCILWARGGDGEWTLARRLEPPAWLNDEAIFAACWLDDARMAVFHGAVGVVWAEDTTGTLQAVAQLRDHTASVTHAVLAGDGTLLSVGYDSKLHCWGPAALAASGSPGSAARGHADIGMCVAADLGQRVAVSGCHDGSAAVWGLGDGSLRGLFHGHDPGSVVQHIATDGEFVVSSCRLRMIIKWRVDDLSEVARFERGALAIGGFRRDAKQVVWMDGKRRLLLSTLEDPPTDLVLAENSPYVTYAAFSRAGDRLLLGLQGRLVQAYDTRTGELLGEFRIPTTSLNREAADAAAAPTLAPGGVNLDAVRSRADEVGLPGFVCAICDDQVLFATSKVHRARFGRIGKARKILLAPTVLEGHSGRIRSLEILRRDCFVTVSADMTARVWNERGEVTLLLPIRAPPSVACLATGAGTDEGEEVLVMSSEAGSLGVARVCV